MPRKPNNAPGTARTGTLVFLGAVTMVFAAFTSALIVRRALGEWGGGVPFPATLWVSTALIAASSAWLEWGRRSRGYASFRASRGETPDAESIAASTSSAAPIALGAAFLSAQGWAWRELIADGVSLAEPGAAFFYVLTAAHGAHVWGGLFALAWGNPAAARLYWHFMAGLWLYLLILFQTAGR